MGTRPPLAPCSPPDEVSLREPTVTICGGGLVRPRSCDRPKETIGNHTRNDLTGFDTSGRRGNQFLWALGFAFVVAMLVVGIWYFVIAGKGGF